MPYEISKGLIKNVIYNCARTMKPTLVELTTVGHGLCRPSAYTKSWEIRQIGKDSWRAHRGSLPGRVPAVFEW